MLLIFHTVAHEIRYASKALHHVTSINYIRLCYWKCTHNNKNIIITYLNIHLHSKICFDTSCTLNFFMLLPLETKLTTSQNLWKMNAKRAKDNSNWVQLFRTKSLYLPNAIVSTNFCCHIVSAKPSYSSDTIVCTEVSLKILWMQNNHISQIRCFAINLCWLLASGQFMSTKSLY